MNYLELSVLPHLFIYPTFVYISMDSCIFYFIVWVVSILLYRSNKKMFFKAQTFGCWELSLFLCSFDMFHQRGVCALFSGMSLLSGTRKFSRLILCISQPSSGISCFSWMSHGSFYWSIVFETKIWVLGLLIAADTYLAFWDLSFHELN